MAQRCIIFFKSGKKLGEAVKECREAAYSGSDFNGFSVVRASSIMAEDVWDAKEGICHLLIFEIPRRRSNSQPNPDILRILLIEVDKEELFFWLRQYGTSQLDNLAEPQSIAGYVKVAAHG
jgi:hypothetical protein